MPSEAHLHIDNKVCNFGDNVYVEVDRIAIFMQDRKAFKFDTELMKFEECEHVEANLPFFVQMTFCPELLLHHNWRNRVIYAIGEKYYRLHRESYNEFTWVELKPLNFEEVRSMYGGRRRPEEWEQLLGKRVDDTKLKAMGLPRDSTKPLTVTEYFEAVR